MRARCAKRKTGGGWGAEPNNFPRRHPPCNITNNLYAAIGAHSAQATRAESAFGVMEIAVPGQGM